MLISKAIQIFPTFKGVDFIIEKRPRQTIFLRKANFGLRDDITSAENRVPPPVTSCHLLGVPPFPSPLGLRHLWMVPYDSYLQL